jgi:tetratricopeptide (TPR) repeat protein
VVVFHCHFLCLTCFWRLSEEKKDFARAENMYQTVLRFTPNHANTLYNYAVLLDTHLRRKFDAEAFYRKTLDIEPKHAYALYNLAVLLEEKTFSGTPDQGNSYHSTNFIYCMLTYYFRIRGRIDFEKARVTVFLQTCGRSRP